ncbi:MAG: glutamate racemase [Myxococcales bacterium]|nr:MAG: glutamate racemase [Myxococcales bacterium]
MIGVYDSGFGGLSVLRELRARLPDRDFLYLGDSGRAPYGGRDCDTLLDFAEQCTERLFDEGCSLVVVACHTISCVALRHLQRRYAGASSSKRVLGVTIPAAEAAVAASRGHIGVIGTKRTVLSGTFEIEIGKLGRHRVSQRAAPLLAPLVEEGWEDTDIARQMVARYVSELAGIDTLVLACTHYPLLMAAFQASCSARILDPAPFVANRLADWLERHPGFDAPGAGTVRAQCTSDPVFFEAHAARFYGAPLADVQSLSAESGRLVPRRYGPPKGQVVR